MRFLLLIAAALFATMTMPTAVQANLAEETAKVDDLRSIREIKHLQALWGHLALRGQWQDMAALAEPDAKVTAPQGEFAGREGIVGWLRDSQGDGADGIAADRLNLRLFLSPVITLAPDGQNATGRWHEISMTGEVAVNAGWAGGTWVIQYRNSASGWRIAAMEYFSQFAGSYEQGWSHEAETLVRAPYHYTPDQVGRILPKREAVVPRAQAELDREADLLLQMGMMQNLASAFGYYLDRGMYEDVAELFYSDNGIYAEGEGNFIGQEGILRYLSRFGPPGLDHGELNDRPQLMPLVSISEGGAIGVVRTFEIGMSGQHGGKGYWSATLNAFLMMRGPDGKWRISLLTRQPIMRADYDEGWAHPLPAALPVPHDGVADRPARKPNSAYPDQALEPLPTVAARLFVEASPEETPFAPTPNALAKAEAFDGAENVSNAYGYYIDQFAWRQTAGLFARDGWKELSYIGTFIGRERVLGSLIQRYGEGGPNDAFQAIHQKTQPYVTIQDEHGEKAFVRTRLFQFNSSSSGPGSWISGIYENQVVKEDGIWRIHGMDLDYVWLGDYASGWTGIDPAASARFGPGEEAIRAFAPDAPLRGEVFAPYPSIRPMGFHFTTPATGRKPAVQLQWSDGHRFPAAE